MSGGIMVLPGGVGHREDSLPNGQVATGCQVLAQSQAEAMALGV